MFGTLNYQKVPQNTNYSNFYASNYNVNQVQNSQTNLGLSNQQISPSPPKNIIQSSTQLIHQPRNMTQSAIIPQSQSISQSQSQSQFIPQFQFQHQNKNQSQTQFQSPQLLNTQISIPKASNLHNSININTSMFRP